MLERSISGTQRIAGPNGGASELRLSYVDVGKYEIETLALKFPEK